MLTNSFPWQFVVRLFHSFFSNNLTFAMSPLRDDDSTSTGLFIGAGCFIASSWWLLRALNRGRRLQESDRPHKSAALTEERIKMCEAHNVGSRGQSALAPPIPYLNQFLVCLQVSRYMDSPNLEIGLPFVGRNLGFLQRLF